MLDATIVSAAMADRAAYDLVAPHITSKDMTPTAGFWWGLVGEWYQRDRSAKSIDKTLLYQQGEKRAPAGKNREPVLAVMRDLPEPVSPSNTANVALEMRRYNVSMELAAAIASQDAKKLPKLHKELGDLMAATTLGGAKKGKWNDAAPIAELFNATGDGNRVPLAPRALTERCAGGALPGQHIVVFGRPDAGKSTFTLNLAAVLGVKHEERVLYVGNEDQINILKRRCVCRVAGMTWADAEADPSKAIAAWESRGGEERIKFAQLIDGSAADLPEKIEEHAATVLVLDQIRGLQGEGDGMTQRLESNGIAVRGLLLKYDLIGISVTQANDRRQSYSQKPPVWLGMEDVDSSRTGLPGTADLLLGIGYDDEMYARGQRALSICKNKLSSEPNSKEGLIVEFDTARSAVR